MKKLFVLTLCVLVMGSVVAEAAEPIVMKIAHSMPTNTPRHQTCLTFKELVEERTKGAVKVEVYPSGQLGNESEMAELMQLGNIEAFRGGVYEAQCPMLDIYTMPFMFKDLKAIQKITRGPIGEKIAQNAETKGLKILATGDGGGFRNFTNNVRPIRKPEDMKGLKMRTPPLESIIETMKALGANPVSIPYVEVYMALKTGVADGQENPFVNIATMKFHEVQKYMTVVNYQFHPEPFTVNLEWFNSLSPELQEIIQTTAKEILVMHDDMIDGAAQEAFDTIKNAGVEITFLTAEERQPFIEQVQSVYDYYTEEKRLFSKADLDEIRKAVQE